MTNFRSQEFKIGAKDFLVDSLSIIPGSEIIFVDDSKLEKSTYQIDYSSGNIWFEDNGLIGKKGYIEYRVFPFSFDKSFEHKKMANKVSGGRLLRNPFKYEYTAKNEDIFYLNGLTKSGSISRGVFFGNNQDLSVNSSLNLQLSGKLNRDISLLASISDDNVPIQAEGNTQQLQEFDRVFIQLFSDNWKLTAGDFFMQRPNSHFMNFNKKVKGGNLAIDTRIGQNKNAPIIRPTFSAAISKGKFSRNLINGVEGNQGPYRLKGSENETFIIVLSGTERIYIDGKLMKRGNEFDYIIDYNTAELTFTANRLITKDSRIVAEFQYSDKNYARSLVHFGTDYEANKLKLWINAYTEQDSKNQPLQQDLSDEDKLFLANIGDSLDQAIVSNINEVDFSENLVLYKMIDTLGYDSVFVYSTDPDSAKYQLGFSLVGANRGNYVQILSSANGRVYEWVEPIAGIPQGEYEPVILLITPKKRQMVTFGGEYNFSKQSYLTWEGGVSNNDINTFSKRDRGDDLGYAFKINSQNKFNLEDKKDPWKFNVGMGYEFVHQHFTTIERIRSVEFGRDWNIRGIEFQSDRHIINGFVGLEKEKKERNIIYNIGILENQGEYSGIKNALALLYNWKGFSLNGDASYLQTSGINNTEFLRYKETLSKQINWIVVGIGGEAELNKVFINKSDSLQSNSFDFTIWEAFIRSADTTTNNFLLNYRRRQDNFPVINKFQSTTKADDLSFSLGLLRNKNHKFRAKMTYRKLDILSPELTTLNPEENILARMEYVTRVLKNVITSNTYYEVGSGLEVKKEFSFVEVQPGQGTFTHIGDVNGNGVKDLNEFEVAVFQDQANFIKIFTPTNEFVRTYTNQFNQGLFLKPEVRWANKSGWKKLVSRFSNRTNYRVSRKVSDRLDYFNPFIGDIADSSLVTLNLGFLNTIYFNRTGTKFGSEFSFQDNRDKSLLTNNVESRKNLTRALRSRWNITRVYTINVLLLSGEKSNISELFTNRNFALKLYEVEPKFTYQPNSKFRASLAYNYEEKTNDISFGGEELISHEVGGEIRYNVAAKGSVRGSYNYIKNEFSSTENASLSYEMLEGLREGSNMTWEISYQRNLSKYMQLSLNYNGRKSEDGPIIHVGGAQVRAFF